MFKLFYNYIFIFENVINGFKGSRGSSLHGNRFQRVVIGGARLHLLFKPEAVVRLVAEVEVVLVVLRGIHRNNSLLGERNVDVKHTECKADYECRPRNVVDYRHVNYFVLN
jgi:hypothetical protein